MKSIMLHTDQTRNITQYSIEHVITGEVKLFNHARRALRYINDPQNRGWSIRIREIRLVEVLEIIY